ncbi:amino acid/amide ABC transporter ATP-binding protein 1, HAAT family [Marinobacter daqiaonensis]|uniref:Amino acid/amide ABC transporter ATP-binding protein 1, HAAT family n=1 Tax=Marinobacter daqiaonensis TaxID=650891 RepID=A0A1I6I6N6_9GAMM|nr:ABC transporter ATP-binding protein [Marinobacter daqiaonensis]SFR62405.1 amino acid/amide ABC transporter ATP-binding protein 1, HAAT family [Marinobacter daqiaonensis]
MSTRNALELKGVKKNFGRAEIIRGVNLDIHEHEKHVIIGPNGAGKSTLFNLISGRLKVSEGSVKLFGKDIHNLPAHKVNRMGLSRSFQVTNLFQNMTVLQNLRCSLLWSEGHKYAFWKSVLKQDSVTERANELMERLNLTTQANTPAQLLTYAEQRSLEIGCTVASGAKVILLDEPTAGMSRTEANDVIQLIQRMTGENTLVVVEHDLNVVFELADRISVLVYGEIIATGTPEDIRNNAAVQEAYLGTEVH